MIRVRFQLKILVSEKKYFQMIELRPLMNVNG